MAIMSKYLAKRIWYYILAVLTVVVGVLMSAIMFWYAEEDGLIQRLIAGIAFAIAILLPKYSVPKLSNADNREVDHLTSIGGLRVAEACVLGIFVALTLLYFSASKWGLLFWSGDIGWRLFASGLTVGAFGILVGMTWRYLSLWPKPH